VKASKRRGVVAFKFQRRHARAAEGGAPNPVGERKAPFALLSGRPPDDEPP